MAIVYRNNALGATSTTTAFTITLSTTAANDIIILEYTHRSTTAGGFSGTYNGPAFSSKVAQLYATSTFVGRTYYSRATGDHNGQTVSVSSLVNSCAGIITVYTGAITAGDPLADATVVGEQNASGDETQAEITTTTDGAWPVLVVANSPDLAVTSQACTAPGALLEKAERLSTGGTDTSIAHASAVLATAGGTGAFTWAQTNGASGSWAYAIRPAVSAAITGTATETIDEADIVAGGKTIIITLSNDKWVASGATFDGQRDEIIAGLDSAQSEATGWNAEVRDKEVVGAVARTSDTVVTITLSAAPAYDITAEETITVTVPATALVNAVSAVAAPTFAIATASAGGNPVLWRQKLDGAGAGNRPD